MGTVWFLYCSNSKDKWLRAIWSEEGCYVRREIFRRVALYLSFLLRMVKISFFLSFPRESNRVPTSWCQIFLLSPTTDINARYFSITFIICPKVINQNTIDFWSNGLTDRDWHFSISRDSLLISTTRLFNFGDPNFLDSPGCWSDIRSFAQTQTLLVVDLLRWSNTDWHRILYDLSSESYPLNT